MQVNSLKGQTPHALCLESWRPASTCSQCPPPPNAERSTYWAPRSHSPWS